MAYPTSPVDGQIYGRFKYNSTTSSWDKITGYQFIDLATPLTYEFNYSSSICTTKTITGIPTGTKRILCDIYIGGPSTSDHQVFYFGKGITTSQKGYTEGYNIQPTSSSNFANNAIHAIRLVNHGESDSFRSYYGTWHCSQVVKLNDDLSFGISNNGYSGSSGWIYIVVKSISYT